MDGEYRGDIHGMQKQKVVCVMIVGVTMVRYIVTEVVTDVELFL